MAANRPPDRELGRYRHEDRTRYYGRDFPTDEPYWQYPGYDYRGQFYTTLRDNNVPRYLGNTSRSPSGPPDYQSARREHGWRGDFAYGTGHSGRGPKGYRRSDERIYEDVNDALTAHPGVDATDIEVEVKEGEVALTGTVNTRGEKRMAEDAAAALPGVKDVHNRLRIASGDSRMPQAPEDSRPRIERSAREAIETFKG